MEGAGHERVVLHSVGKHHQLHAGTALALGRFFRRLADDLAHERHCVHVDPGPGGGHIDRGADVAGGGQCVGDGQDQPPVSYGHALVHQSGEAADQVHPAGRRRLIHGYRKGNIVLGVAALGHHGDRRYGDALVDDGDPQLPLDGLAGGNQLFGAAGDLVVDLPGRDLRIGAAAVPQGDAHGDGSDVQMLVVDHVQRLHDFVLT